MRSEWSAKVQSASPEGSNTKRTSVTGPRRESIARRVLEEEAGLGFSPIAQRFNGGKILIQPRDSSLQTKEIPIDTFFHKVVMVRDRLRVLEQKINAHKGLSDADKVDLQQYVTRVYGSLTTFNVLFDDDDNRFAGAKESGE